MSKYREIELLKKQEATLLQLHMTFSDQLNRLKVEELALTNLLRLQEEKDNKDDKAVEEHGPCKVKEELENNKAAVLDLTVGHPQTEGEEEEEEEDDSEGEGYNYKDQLTTFLEDLLTQQKQEASQRTGVLEDNEEET